MFVINLQLVMKRRINFEWTIEMYESKYGKINVLQTDSDDFFFVSL